MDYLFASGRMRLYRRYRLARVNGGDHGSAGASSRGLRLTRPAFENAKLYFVASEHAYELDVHSLREFPALANGGCPFLPVRRKFVDELHEVRVSGGDH